MIKVYEKNIANDDAWSNLLDLLMSRQFYVLINIYEPFGITVDYSVYTIVYTAVSWMQYWTVELSHLLQYLQGIYVRYCIQFTE